MRAMWGLATLFVLTVFFLPSGVHAAALQKPANNLGLIAYWSFDDASGTKLSDSSGNAHTGTLSGSTLPTWVTGRFGKGLSFTNSDNYVSIPVSDAFQIGTGDFTVSHWIRFDGFPARYQTTFDGGYVGGAGVLIEFDNTAHVVMLYIRGTPSGPHILSWPFSPTTGVWYDIVAKRTGTNVAVFANGVQLGSAQTDSTSIAKSVWMLGKYSGGEPTVGTMDDFRFYNRALSDAEIKALYQGRAAQMRAPNNLGLVGSWNFDEASGIQAGDASGNKNNGTFVSNPVWISGKHGTALRFDGIDDGIQIGTVVPTAAASFSAWIYINGANSNYGAIFTNWGPGGNAFFIGTQIANPSDIEVYFNNAKIFDITNVPLNTWVHLAVTHNGSTGIGYINGVQTNSAASSLIAASGVTSMGYDVNRSNYAFKGNLDDMRIYNRALSAAEIMRLYSQGATQINTSSTNLTADSSLSSGLVGLWTFDGPDTTDKIYDRSGSSNNAYFNAATATSSRKTIGKLGQGLQWAGTAAYARVATFSNPPSSQMTICAWIKTSSDGLILNINRNPSNIINEGVFKIATGKLIFWDYNGSSYGFADATGYSNTSVTNGAWHHVCFTKDATAGTYYLDGAADGTKTAGLSVSYGTADWVVAADYRDSAGYFAGSMDDVRIYNRALSAVEVKQLYLIGQ